MPLHRFRLVVVALLLVGLSGCGGTEDSQPPSADNEASTAQDDSESTAGSSGEDAGSGSDSESVEAGDYPCGLLSDDDLTPVFGSSLGPGQASTGETTENDVTWTPQSCRWGDDDTLELRLSVAGAEAFPDGGLQCPQPLGIAGEVTPVSGLGTQAWWVWVDISTVEGMLRVCTAAALLDLRLEAPEGESADFQAQASDLAAVVLGQL